MTPYLPSQRLRNVRNYHFWVVVTMLIVGAILHYPQYTIPADLPSPFLFGGLTRHAAERVYLLAPITYAGFSLGVRGGIISLVVALSIMLPRAILISPNLADASLETAGVIGIGAAVNLIFHMHRREKERIRATDALLKADDEKWRSSFNALEDMMLIIDRDYNIENINDSGLALLGKSREEIIGEKCYQIISGGDSPIEECPCLRTLETKQVESSELYMERLGRYFSIKSAPIFDDNGEIVKFVDLRRDITELKRAEEMLAKIVDGSSISTFVINKNHKVTHWNTAVAALTGIKRAEIVGTGEQWRAFWPEKRPVMADLIVDGVSADEIEEYYQGRSQQSLLIDGGYEAEGFYPALGRGGKWLHFTASPIKGPDGEIIGAIETLQDITERKQADQKLKERVKELQCLYNIANIAQRPGISLDELYQAVADVLPPSWQYSGIACAKIVIEGNEFKTANYRESEWKQSSDITVSGKKVGVVEVNYLEEQPDADEGPFSKEERLLIDAVAERLGRITDEKRLQDNCRFYAQQVTRAQEEERKRIARELHDDLAQSLLRLMQRLDYLTTTKRRKLSNSELIQSLNEMHNQAVETLEGLQRCARDLRPPILDHFGLLAALEWMAEELVKHGIDAQVKVIGSARSLPAEVELLLFRIVQEALTNTRRHAEASKSWVTIEYGDDKILLTVNDNGKGFKLPRSLGDFASAGKLGLAGMQERARLIEGKLKLESQLGKGTKITIEVPI